MAQLSQATATPAWMPGNKVVHERINCYEGSGVKKVIAYLQLLFQSADSNPALLPQTALGRDWLNGLSGYFQL